MRKRKPPKGKHIKPTLWFFCEGKTEASYVRWLRRKYRTPMIIKEKVMGSSITEKKIRSFKRHQFTHKSDKNFLVYDSDVPETVQRLNKIANAELIISNPCFELWYLLHFKNQSTQVDCDYCTKEISKRLKENYKKGEIGVRLETRLESKVKDAIKRAKQMKVETNPYTNVYLLIELLESL